MKKVRIALLVAAICQYPVGAHAQNKGKAKAAAKAAPAEESDDEEEAPAKGAAKGGDEGGGDEKEGEASGEEGAEGEEGGEEEGGEEGEKPEGDLEGICKVDPEACPKLDFDKEAARDIKEQVYAVQQVFALRVRRFELQPYWAITLNDQFVSHPGPGLGLNYWITQVLAVGVNGTYYQPFNSDSAFNFETRRAARIAVPLSEYQWGAALNFTYVPIAGKFSGFGDFIFQYDAYVVGGVGALSTRPIPTVDPDNRSFQFEPRLAFNAGLGLRIFFSRWFAADLEVRDYIFSDKIEATSVNAAQAKNKDTWYDKKARLTNDVQAQLGVSVFIPFSFDYRLPK
ncbi:MAG TPA: outer membrane beta-barrel domain-containing protein [Polyangiaceae bacterium]|nr:outer membrane beta-barrel domain-containing protein [Polyangiaceae bacterium]